MKASKMAKIAADALSGRGFSVVPPGQGATSFSVMEGGEQFEVNVTGGPELEPGDTVQDPRGSGRAEIKGMAEIGGEPYATVETEDGEALVVPAKELIRGDQGSPTP